MRKSKEIYNEVAFKNKIKVINEDELKNLKNILIEILDDVVYVCNKYNLKYMLCGGTLLGAIRHKGFIPWDDDIDIMMPRQDYERLEELIIREFSSKYYVLTPKNNNLSPFGFTKIILKETELIELENEGLQYNKGVFIDVFCIDNVPDTAFKKIVRGSIYSILSKIPVLCCNYKFPSKTIIELCNSSKELKKQYSLRRKFGLIFSVIDILKWKELAEYIVNDKNNNSLYVTIASGTNGYFGEILLRKDILKNKMVEFEGKMYNAPYESDKYLKKLYSKDYMELPPIEKRQRHLIIKYKERG